MGRQEDKCRLMVIDDESIVCKRLKQIMEKAGFEVAVFGDGAHAVEELNNKHYDIILTDFRMDGMDGMKVLVSAKEKNPASKVIILTGFAETEMVREAFRKGVFDVLSKPVEIDTIKQVIGRAERELNESKNAAVAALGR
ncbi:MAG: response regulator [Nitrospirae bacterium]|nr:response regulator [Nitrospirota bacterium]MBF0533877.1 response regulator [Nitrospirota bacterium]MBF0615414.1 response regulator [Nitrospirota bacterium]